MKILHVETGRNLYGGALQVVYLLRGLREKGVTSVLACPDNSEIAGCTKEIADRVYAVPMRGELDVSFTLKLKDIIRLEKPDIVHLHSRRGADIWGLVSARLSGTKVVISRRVDNPEPALIARLKYGICDRVITISNGIRDVLLKAGIPERKVVCVHSAVDTGLFNPECEREYFLKELGLRADSKVIGVSAQLIARKGHKYLIEALPDVLRTMPDTKIIFFGKGPMEAELKGLCSRSGVSGNVIFAGFREDLHLLLPCLDILVHPALMEGLGVSLLQAASCGVPIIASSVGGIPEAVRHGVNGMLLPPGNTQAIAEAILNLFKNSILARQMGEAGRRIAEEEFSILRMVQGNLRVYQDILA